MPLVCRLAFGKNSQAFEMWAELRYFMVSWWALNLGLRARAWARSAYKVCSKKIRAWSFPGQITFLLYLWHRTENHNNKSIIRIIKVVAQLMVMVMASASASSASSAAPKVDNPLRSFQSDWNWSVIETIKEKYLSKDRNIESHLEPKIH